MTACTVTKATLEALLPWRALFLQEANCQIRYDACHARGWTDSYLLRTGERTVGYAAVKGDEPHGRDTVFELYIVPPARQHARALFMELCSVSRASHVESQTNVPCLPELLIEFGREITSDTVLFEAHAATSLRVPGAHFRRRRPDDAVFDHAAEPVGDFVVELEGQVTATGGFLQHYNPPFADLFMEVVPAHRRRGIGSFLVQEVARECYLAGRVPAARCSIGNVASRATLTRAGLRVRGYILRGVLPTALADERCT